MAAQQPPPPAGAPPPQPGAMGAASDAMTMEKLIEKEREVEQRMAALRERQGVVMQALKSLQPNWPGHCLCIGPIVYHDIDEAVPQDRKSFAKTSYGNYFFTIFLLCYNLIVAIAGIASENSSAGDETEYGLHLGISFVHMLGIPGAFMVWHFQIYKAVQTIGPLNRYSVAFLGVVIALLYDCFMAVGVTAYGGAGWMYAFTLKDKKVSKVPFYMCLVCAVFWTGQAIFFLYFIYKLSSYKSIDKKAMQGGAAGGGAAGGNRTAEAA